MFSDRAFSDALSVPVGEPVFVSPPDIGTVADEKVADAGISKGTFNSRPIYSLLSGFALRRSVQVKS